MEIKANSQTSIKYIKNNSFYKNKNLKTIQPQRDIFESKNKNISFKSNKITKYIDKKLKGKETIIQSIGLVVFGSGVVEGAPLVNVFPLAIIIGVWLIYLVGPKYKK